MASELPAEIAEARDRHDTAISNLAMAETALEAAQAEADAATARAHEAQEAHEDADVAEVAARRGYIEVLKRHGYVQTADGPRPDPGALAAQDPAGLAEHDPKGCGCGFHQGGPGNVAPAEVTSTP